MNYPFNTVVQKLLCIVPLQFLAILNMLAALTYKSQASSTLEELLQYNEQKREGRFTQTNRRRY